MGREASGFPPHEPTNLIEPLAQLLFLARFLCFMAVVYLGLHKIVSRISTKPNSKLLWFFSVVTRPLTWPVRRWLAPDASDERLLTAALYCYGLLWLGLVALDRIATAGPR